jgi:energy-coupling factor transport system permease protein
MSEHSLRYIDNDSFFTRIDALSKLLWVILIILTTFQLTTNLGRAIMLTAVLFVMIVLARVPLKTVWQAMPIILIMGSLLFFVHLFTAPSTQTIHFAGMDFGKEGFDKGLQYFFRITIMVLASFILIWTTDIRDLMVGLVSIGMPYRYAFTVFMALRFLPVVQQEVDAVKSAHAIRGRASRSPLQHRFRLWQRYMFTVIVNGLRKAENTALAIESRGFGAYPDRTFVKEFHWSTVGIVVLVIYLLFGIGLVLWDRNILF